MWLQAFVIVPLLSGLGCWQLERSEHKTALLAQWQQAPSYQGLQQPGLQRFDRVRVTGVLDPVRWFLLDNRVRQGVVGYDVIGLLQPSEDSALLLVNLGWVAGGTDRQQLPAISLPAARLEVQGRLDLPEGGLQLAADDWGNRWPRRIQQVSLERMTTVIEQPVLPWLLRLDTELLSGQPTGWQPVTLPPERHLGYAVQWFGLALVWLVMTGWLLQTLHRSTGIEDGTDE